MAVLSVLLTLLYVSVCVGLIFFVLIQASKGSGLSGAFGAIGGGESLFGATGSYSLVVKVSVGLAVAFLILSVLFGYLPQHQKRGVVDAYYSDYITVQEAVKSSAKVDEQSTVPGDLGTAPSSSESKNP
ncbi:MAG: preprotein translocase subunit SecG [bacterium]